MFKISYIYSFSFYIVISNHEKFTIYLCLCHKNIQSISYSIDLWKAVKQHCLGIRSTAVLLLNDYLYYVECIIPHFYANIYSLIIYALILVILYIFTYYLLYYLIFYYNNSDAIKLLIIKLKVNYYFSYATNVITATFRYFLLFLTICNLFTHNILVCLGSDLENFKSMCFFRRYSAFVSNVLYNG